MQVWRLNDKSLIMPIQYYRFFIQKTILGKPHQNYPVGCCAGYHQVLWNTNLYMCLVSAYKLFYIILTEHTFTRLWQVKMSFKMKLLSILIVSVFYQQPFATVNKHVFLHFMLSSNFIQGAYSLVWPQTNIFLLFLHNT